MRRTRVDVWLDRIVWTAYLSAVVAGVVRLLTPHRTFKAAVTEMAGGGCEPQCICACGAPTCACHAIAAHMRETVRG